jgi:hypothetical protein
MRQIIADMVAIHLAGDPFAIEWQGAEGRTIVTDAISTVYETLAALEGQDST